jgi:transcriptional regulator with XRE-family HTH domain
MSVKRRVKPAPHKVFRKPGKQLTQTLAENLRAYRRLLQLSQEELAEQCGLHRTYVGSVERSERNVTLSTLEVFAQALDVSVPQLLTPTIHEDQDDA